MPKKKEENKPTVNVNIDHAKRVARENAYLSPIAINATAQNIGSMAKPTIDILEKRKVNLGQKEKSQSANFPGVTVHIKEAGMVAKNIVDKSITLTEIPTSTIPYFPDNEPYGAEDQEQSSFKAEGESNPPYSSLPHLNLPVKKIENFALGNMYITKNIVRPAPSVHLHLPSEDSDCIFRIRLINIPILNYHIERKNNQGEKLVKKINEYLYSNKICNISGVAIAGGGGVGKSQLAFQYANIYDQSYEAIVVIHCETPEEILQSFKGFLKGLDKYKENLVLVESFDRAKVIQEVKIAVSAVSKKAATCLFIFDNAEANKDVNEWCAIVVQHHVIITSRYQLWPALISIPLDNFNDNEKASVTDYMLKVINNQGKACEQKEAAWGLAEELGWLPLAIGVAIHTICGKMLISEYVDQFRDSKAKRKAFLSSNLLSEALALPIEKANQKDRLIVYSTWEISLIKIETRDRCFDAREVLNLCAYLNPDNIHKDLFTEKYHDALGHLADNSLISIENGKVIKIHRLLQEVTRIEHAFEEKVNHWLLEAFALINEAFTYNRNDKNTFQKSTQLIPHIEALRRHAKKIHGGIVSLHNEQVGQLLAKTGDYYFSYLRPYYGPTISLLEEAEEILNNLYKEGKIACVSSLADALCGLGMACHARRGEKGREEKGRKKTELAHQLYSQIFKSKANYGSCACFINLGYICFVQHEKVQTFAQKKEFLMQAAELFTKAVELSREVKLEYGADLAHAKHALGTVYLHLGDYYVEEELLGEAIQAWEQSGKNFQDALALRENLFGCEHVNTARSHDKLGAALARLDRLEEAENEYQVALSVQVKFLHAKHSNLNDTNNHINQLQKLKRVSNLIQKIKEYTGRVITPQSNKYIPSDCARNISAAERVSLEIECKQFLDSQKNLLIILGNSGSGKSLFFSRIIPALIDKRYQILVFIPLSKIEYSKRAPISSCLDYYFYKCLKYTSDDVVLLKSQRRFQWLFIFDGYDELKESSIKLYPPEEMELWNAKIIVSSRTSYLPSREDYLLRLSPYKENKKTENISQVLYMAPFSRPQVYEYLNLLADPLRNQCQELIEKNQLLDLVIQPIVLYLVTLISEELTAKINSGKYKNRSITRTDIYEEIMEKWFSREARKVGAIQQLIAFKEIRDGFIHFSQDLAYEMLCENVLEVAYHPETKRKGRWGSVIEQEKSILDEFFNDANNRQDRLSSPIEMLGENHWRFLHKTLRDYLAVSYLDSFLEKEIKAKNLNGFLMALNQRLLVREEDIIAFWGERLTIHQQENYNFSLKEIKFLLSVVKQSSQTENIHKASANAITVLNQARVNFSHQNFRGIKIPHADLSYSICYQTNFRRANLEKVNWHNAYLVEAKWQKANLKKIDLGECAYINLPAYPDSLASYVSPQGELYWLVGCNDGRIYQYRHRKRAIVNTYPYTSIPLSEINLTILNNFKIVLAVDANNHILACASGRQTPYEYTIQRWCLLTHKLIDEKPVEYQIFSISFSPSGRIIAFSGKKTEDICTAVQVWDLDSGNFTKLYEREQWINGLIFSPDEKWLAAGDDGDEALLFNFVSKQLFELNGHRGSVNCVAFSPNGQWLASADNDGKIQLWDVITQGLCFELKNHTGGIFSIVFSLDNQWLISGSIDGTVQWCWLPTAKIGAVFRGYTSKITGLAIDYARNRWMAAIGESSKQLQFWQTLEEMPLIKQGHQDEINCLAFSSDGHYLVSASTDETVRLWLLSETVQSHDLVGHEWPVEQVIFSLDNRYLISSGNGIRIWDVPTQMLSKQLYSGTGFNNTITLIPTGTQLIAYNDDREIRFLNFPSGKETKRFSLKQQLKPGAKSRAFSPDAKWFAASREEKIYVWDIETLAFKCILEEHTETILYLAFSLDSQWLASGGQDKCIIIRSLNEPKSSCLLLNQKGWVRAIAFHPIQPWLLSGGQDKTLYIWEYLSGKCLKEIYLGFDITSIAVNKNNTLGIGSDKGDVAYLDISNLAKPRLIWLKNKASSLNIERLKLWDSKNLSRTNKKLGKQRGATLSSESKRGVSFPHTGPKDSSNVSINIKKKTNAS